MLTIWGLVQKMMSSLLYLAPLILRREISPLHQVTTVHYVFTHCSQSGNNSWQTYRNVSGVKETGGWTLSPLGRYLDSLSLKEGGVNWKAGSKRCVLLSLVQASSPKSKVWTKAEP